MVQPLPHARDSSTKIVCMRLDVLACYIGYEALITIALQVENQTVLFFIMPGTIALRPEEDPQFERHIESWKRMLRIKFRARQIMDSVLALVNDAEDVINATLRAIIDLECASSGETAVEDCKNERIKNGLKRCIEWAVDKDLGRVIRWPSTFRHFFFEVETEPGLVGSFEDCRMTSCTAVLSTVELVEDGGCFAAGTRRSG